MKEPKVSVMRALSLLLVFGVSVGVGVDVAQAQPAQPAQPEPAGSAAPAGAPPAPASAAAGDPGVMRKACAEAMNANPEFARSIIQAAIDTDRVSVKAVCADIDTVKTHQDAVAHVEKNERHVIGAYAAMWVIAAGFLLYLMRRQQRLKVEIDQLRRELDLAAKDGKDGK